MEHHPGLSEESRSVTSSASRLLPLCMLLTSGLLLLLTGAGIITSLRTEGRLPQVALEYGSYHLPLLSPARIETGIVDLATAVAVDFDNAEARSRLVQAAERTQNPAALVIALQGFLASDADDPELHRWLAAALLAAGNPQQGLIHSRESLRLNDGDPTSLVTHGDIQSALGNHQEARLAYQRALEIDPRSVSAQQGLQRLPPSP